MILFLVNLKKVKCKGIVIRVCYSGYSFISEINDIIVENK